MLLNSIMICSFNEITKMLGCWVVVFHFRFKCIFPKINHRQPLSFPQMAALPPPQPKRSDLPAAPNKRETILTRKPPSSMPQHRCGPFSALGGSLYFSVSSGSATAHNFSVSGGSAAAKYLKMVPHHPQVFRWSGREAGLCPSSPTACRSRKHDTTSPCSLSSS